ncbi:MAG TPA: tetratricopeptide repeat protein [Alphaproteobacteria bacterium]|nr:tetratricopeptide repeat protein [Alphaproteobacteria bacterium]
MTGTKSGKPRPSTADSGASLRAALERNPDDGDAHKGLGQLALAAGDTAAALSHFGSAVRAEPGDAEAQFHLGNARLQSGDAEGAVVAYERAAALADSVAEVFANLGSALHQLGRDREAAVALDRALGLKTDFAEAHNTLGTVRLDTGDTAAAREAFERALDLAPDLVAAFENNVTNIDADAEPVLTLGAERLVAPPQFVLYFGGTLNGVDGACKFGEDAVARRAENAPVMTRDQTRNGLAVIVENFEGADLVHAHEAAIAFDIHADDGGEAAFDLFRGHGKNQFGSG